VLKVALGLVFARVRGLSPVSVTPQMLSTHISFISDAIQGGSGKKVTILRGASIGHCEKESSYELVSISE
jgi:hypothetical protein